MNNDSFSIIHPSEDKDLASSFKKEFASKWIYDTENGKVVFMEKACHKFSFS